jgi:GDP-4-dehydro-6-deoxy-D-mannose reductase
VSLRDGRLLVTGASGFVGRHLCAHLAELDCEVVRLARQGDVDFLVDVSDAGELLDAVTHCRPSGIFHLAAVAYVPDAERDPGLTRGVNVDGTRYVLEAADAVGARVVFVSSGAVYGVGPDSGPPFAENMALRPRGVYARTKAEAESVCVARGAQQSIVRVRAFNHTGPGQAPTYVCSGFARQIAEVTLGIREPVIHVGDLSAERDFCDVRDIVRAYAAAYERGTAGEAYNVCSGVPTRIETVLQTLLEISGVGAEVRTDETRMRDSESTRSWGANDKARSQLEWQPEIGLRTTLEDTFLWWRSQLENDRGSRRGRRS